jgi:hypothetical protein
MNWEGGWKWIGRINSLWSLAQKIITAIIAIGGGLVGLIAWVDG